MTDDRPEPTRRGALSRARAHPWATGGLAVLAVGGLTFVLVWFQPQALLFDTVVDEQFPGVDSSLDETADPAEGDTSEGDTGEGDTSEGDTGEGDTSEGDTEGDTPPAGSTPPPDEPEDPSKAGGPPEPVPLAIGGFESRNRYTVTGTAAVYELADGERVLRLEDFESTNGPDLYVYLTAADHADTDEELDRDVVDLGALTGNIGNQNYDIPADVDLAHHDTVVIWCRRFTTSFGAADLEPG